MCGCRSFHKVKLFLFVIFLRSFTNGSDKNGLNHLEEVNFRKGFFYNIIIQAAAIFAHNFSSSLFFLIFLYIIIYLSPGAATTHPNSAPFSESMHEVADFHVSHIHCIHNSSFFILEASEEVFIFILFPLTCGCTCIFSFHLQVCHFLYCSKCIFAFSIQFAYMPACKYFLHLFVNKGLSFIIPYLCI